MFKKESYGLVFSTIYSLILSLVLTIYALWYRDNLSFESLLMALLPAFAISITTGTYIPLMKIGKLFASKFIKNEGSLSFYLLRLIPTAIIMASIMSFSAQFINAGFNMSFSGFLIYLPQAILLAYCTGFCSFNILSVVVKKLCSK